MPGFVSYDWPNCTCFKTDNGDLQMMKIITIVDTNAAEPMRRSPFEFAASSLASPNRLCAGGLKRFNPSPTWSPTITTRMKTCAAPS